MKQTLLFIAMAIITLGLASCKKDKDNETKNKSTSLFLVVNDVEDMFLPNADISQIAHDLGFADENHNGNEYTFVNRATNQQLEVTLNNGSVKYIEYLAVLWTVSPSLIVDWITYHGKQISLPIGIFPLNKVKDEISNKYIDYGDAISVIPTLSTTKSAGFRFSYTNDTQGEIELSYRQRDPNLGGAGADVEFIISTISNK